MADMMLEFQDIVDDFTFIESWEDKYRYIIDLGRKLAPLEEAFYTAENKVRGCASQVWLVSDIKDGVLTMTGDSDAHIVKGLVALIVSLYANKTPKEILSTDAHAELARLALTEHLTPQRSNGVAAMVKRITELAENHQGNGG